MPDAHSVHSVSPHPAYIPALHSLHSVDASKSRSALPDEQNSQDDAAGPAYWPGWHCWQPLSRYSPSAVHVRATGCEPAKPGRQVAETLKVGPNRLISVTL